MSSNPDVAPTDDIEAPSSGHQFRQLLTTKGFLALVISNTLGFSGEALRLAAQAWWILDEGGSNTAVGLSAGLRVIPVILISLYAGVMIDRFGGKRVLLYERWILVLLALATAFLLFWDGVEIWHIVVLSTVAGTTIAIGMPATNTLVAEIVPKDLRPQANILNQFGPSAGRTIGPLLAGILIAVWNAATAFVGLAVVYVISSLITMRIPARGTVNNSAASAIQQIREGIRYIRRNSVVMWILILIGFSTIFWALIGPLLPAMAIQVLNTSEIGFGWMYGAMAIGNAVASIGLARLGKPKRAAPSLLLAATMYGAGLVLLGFTHTYWLSLLYLFLMGLRYPLWIAPIMTMLQNYTAPEHLGRVMAVHAIAIQSVSIGWLLGGWLLDVIGIPATAIVGVVGGWTVLLIVMIRSKELRAS